MDPYTEFRIKIKRFYSDILLYRDREKGKNAHINLSILAEKFYTQFEDVFDKPQERKAVNELHE